jgi:hydrogenase maturation protein HypF
MFLLNANGEKILCSDPIYETAKFLKDGKIVSIKGLGGYHLACDAQNKDAVLNLRNRKVREDKPFALMAKNLETIKQYCLVSKEEEKLLKSSKKPIVLLRKLNNIKKLDGISDGNNTYGIMLPYTPVHKMIFNINKLGNKDLDMDLIVLTSGNKSSEPIFYMENDAITGLNGIFDYMLTNNLEINFRNDDSVTRIFNNKEYILRKGRGYVPNSIQVDFLAQDTPPTVLALGGELKNTICINNNNKFYLSQHIGDLENIETFESFTKSINYFKKFTQNQIKYIAFDMHPGYMSSKYALDYDQDVIKMPIQHHHAHMAACMAENNLDEDVIGVIFDGTGYGEDGKIWGGEFFSGNYKKFTREAQFDYISIAGGDMAIKEVWRIGVSLLMKYHKKMEKSDNEFGVIVDGIKLFDDIEYKKIILVSELIQKKINIFETSSMGRIFDAIATIVGIRSSINYEGQAAIELENIIENSINDEYSYTINKGNIMQISLETMLDGLLIDLTCNKEKKYISAKFHNTIAKIIVDICDKMRQKGGINKVVLSGGVFQNMYLLKKAYERLTQSKFNVFTHSLIPTNDGGISFGQSVIVVKKLT